MSESDAARWERYYRERPPVMPAPARVLAGHEYLLPRQGRALDLACGAGGNALFLAAHGLETHAWDISPAALQRLSSHAGQLQLSVRTRECDLTRQHPGPDEFDLVVVSYYLDRALIPSLRAALKPGGLVFYQTFTRQKTCGRGPDNPDFLLDPNELLQLFSGLELIVYLEPGAVGSVDRGLRDEAMLIARRR